MNILFRCNKLKYNKILKELNTYWNTLEHKNIQKKKKTDYFCCESYDFFVHRYSISIWAVDDLSENCKDEILKMLQIIFKDKKITGFADRFNEEKEWVIEILSQIENIHKVSSDIPNKWKLSELEECKEYVSSLSVNDKDADKKERLLSILNIMIINSKSI